MSKKVNITATREKFLDIAQEAFLRKSYREVSMRELSQISGIGLSNIYNYFKNKDEIFDMLVLPTVRYIDEILKRHHDVDNMSVEVFFTDSYTEFAAHEIEELIIQHRNALLLLFFKSKGSRYENYRDELVRKNSSVGGQYLENLRKKYANYDVVISPIFVSVASNMYVNIIEHLLQVEPLTEKVIYDVVDTYIQFISAGWERIIHLDHEKKI